MNQKQKTEIQTKLLFCIKCESANIETIEKRDDLIYICNVCRDFSYQNEEELLENNFDDNLVIDSSN